MKNIKLSLVFLLVTVVTNSGFSQTNQVGIYKTYEDYLNDKVTDYGKYHNTFHAAGNFKVVFINSKGEKVKIDIDKKEFWGYKRSKGNILRIDDKNNPNVIIFNGNIVVYGNYSTQIDSEGNARMTSNQFVPLISKGGNGQMIALNRRNLIPLLEGNQKYIAELKKARYQQDLIDVIMKYNKEKK